MDYISLFSGIAGMEKGIEQAYGKRIFGQSNMQGYCADAFKRISNVRQAGRNGAENATCVGYSEIDKNAIAIYKYNYPNHTNYGDATGIICDSLPDFDFLCGGFPCQTFSIAGKRAGFADTRGTLFFEIARILEAKKPKHFLLENVKGLFSHDEGRTFKTIINTLTDIGYCVEWDCLNSKFYGVPQNRERVFIVGHLGRLPGGEVFPIGENCGTDFELSGQSTNCLTARYYGAQGTGTYIIERELDAQIQQLNYPKHSNNQVYGSGGISPALNTMQGGNRQPKVMQINDSKESGGKQPYQQNRVYSDSGVAPANCADLSCGSVAVETSSRIRRLTPRECELLQGFPIDYTKYGIDEKGNKILISDSSRYKALGNAVTTFVIEAIVKKMMVCCQ